MPRLVTADAAAAAAFYADALARGHEGVMAKALDMPDEAGSRGAGWLKVKQAHTLDLVVLGADWGHGRRKRGRSNLHRGARDPAGGWVMLGKTFKGMSDALLERLTRELLAREVSRDAGRVHCAARARGRDRVQRPAVEPAVPRRAGAALRAREGLPA